MYRPGQDCDVQSGKYAQNGVQHSICIYIPRLRCHPDRLCNNPGHPPSWSLCIDPRQNMPGKQHTQSENWMNGVGGCLSRHISHWGASKRQMISTCKSSVWTPGMRGCRITCTPAANSSGPVNRSWRMEDFGYNPNYMRVAFACQTDISYKQRTHAIVAVDEWS